MNRFVSGAAVMFGLALLATPEPAGAQWSAAQRASRRRPTPLRPISGGPWATYCVHAAQREQSQQRLPHGNGCRRGQEEQEGHLVAAG
jgi:hypothetical protein